MRFSVPSRGYRQGVDTFLTVPQNSQVLLQAQTGLAQSTATVSTDLVALYKSLGGGWETAFPVEPQPATPLVAAVQDTTPVDVTVPRH